MGVNKFQKKEEAVKDILRVNSEVEQKQIERLKKLKARRDNLAVQNARTKLAQAAKGTENLMPPLLEAVRCYTSLGEISDTLREVFGMYRERIVI